MGAVEVGGQCGGRWHGHQRVPGHCAAAGRPRRALHPQHIDQGMIAIHSKHSNKGPGSQSRHFASIRQPCYASRAAVCNIVVGSSLLRDELYETMNVNIDQHYGLS